MRGVGVSGWLAEMADKRALTERRRGRRLMLRAGNGGSMAACSLDGQCPTLAPSAPDADARGSRLVSAIQTVPGPMEFGFVPLPTGGLRDHSTPPCRRRWSVTRAVGGSARRADLRHLQPGSCRPAHVRRSTCGDAPASLSGRGGVGMARGHSARGHSAPEFAPTVALTNAPREPICATVITTAVVLATAGAGRARRSSV